MVILSIAIYLLITFVLTIIGIEKHTNGFRIFFISLLLTPLVGFIYYSLNSNKSTHISYYHCHECNYIYPVKIKNCPICMEDGIKIRLKKYESPYKISEKIKELKLA
jgi:hypothetical protein